VLTFTRSHDLFGDGSVVVVDLAWHTPGSVSVLLHTYQIDESARSPASREPSGQCTGSTL